MGRGHDTPRDGTTVIHERRWGRAGLLVTCLILTSGCTERTTWDARGSWSGRVTMPGEVAVQRESGLTDLVAGSTEDRIRLCALDEIVLSLTFVPIERDRPAAIEVRTARPLCGTGPAAITGGSVMIWRNPGDDPNVLAAARSDEWTVSGELEITGYSDPGLPHLDAGDTATTERVQGTFSLTATDGAGALIRIEEGAFELEVIASRVKLSLS